MFFDRCVNDTCCIPPYMEVIFQSDVILDEDELFEREPTAFVPLKKTALTGDVNGPLAALKLVQEFSFTREQHSKPVEAVYRFPLPGDAAVTKVTVKFGDTEIETELREREKAEKRYEAAKRDGRQAALVTRESTDVFTLHLTGIKPDQPVMVTTEFVEKARDEGEGWSLRQSVTPAPRFERKDERGTRHGEGNPLALAMDPGHRFTADVRLHHVGKVKSRTHAIITEKMEGGITRVQLKEGEVVPDRDFVLDYAPGRAKGIPTLDVHTQVDGGRCCFLAHVSPPEKGTAEGSRREIILMVDHSSSMDGPKREAANYAAKALLAKLTDGDMFTVVAFDHRQRWFSKEVMEATQENVKNACAFVENDWEHGSTELGVTLEQATGIPRAEGKFARHIVMITDDQVTDAGRVVTAAEGEITTDAVLRIAGKEGAEALRRRISVVCIDTAPNATLANMIAEAGGGIVRFISPKAKGGEEMASALERVCEFWDAPVMRNAGLVCGEGVKAIAHDVKGGTVDLGDLPAGMPLWVAGWVPLAQGQKAIKFALVGEDGKAVAEKEVEVEKDSPALKAMVGAHIVNGVEYAIHARLAGEKLNAALVRLGVHPLMTMVEGKTYAENQYGAGADALRRLLVSASLEYGIPCMETAFIGVSKTRGKIDGTVEVANALPADWERDSGIMHIRRIRTVAGGRKVHGGLPPVDDIDDVPVGGLDVCRLDGGVRGFDGGMSLREAPMVPMAIPAVGAPGYAEERKAKETAALYSGSPSFTNGRALLFWSGEDKEGKLPFESCKLRKLMLQFEGDVSQLEGVKLLIYVGDKSEPKATIDLKTVLGMDGKRPLNLEMKKGEEIWLALANESGREIAQLPKLTVQVGLADVERKKVLVK